MITWWLQSCAWSPGDHGAFSRPWPRSGRLTLCNQNRVLPPAPVHSGITNKKKPMAPNGWKSMESKSVHFGSSRRVPQGDFSGRNGIPVPRTELGHLGPCPPFPFGTHQEPGPWEVTGKSQSPEGLRGAAGGKPLTRSSGEGEGNQGALA